MSTFPGSPKVMKGAVVGLDPFNPLASIVVFQYNPDTLSRTLRAQTAGGNVDRVEALRLTGPPEETISLDVEIDATDQMERDGGIAAGAGLYPALAALEMLIYPKSSLVIANQVLALAGVIEVIPPEAPLAVFVWGPNRILPVRLTELSITEESFDPDLNPIRARVSLSLRVLNYRDLGLLSPGGAMFMVHQIAKEVMATASSAGNVATLATGG